VPRWHLIDKTLGLDLPDPPETYHTSAHLFADLSIPEGVPGTLPTASRTRAGLGAEVEEDLGGRRPRGRDGGAARPARSRPSRSGESDARRDSTRGDSAGGESTRGESARGSRRRGGRDPINPTADGAGPAAENGDEARRPRRRRRVGEVVAEGIETGGVATSSAAPAEAGATETAAGSGEGRARRRRRGGRGRRPAQSTES
jgi:hypothetical protein